MLLMMMMVVMMIICCCYFHFILTLFAITIQRVCVCACNACYVQCVALVCAVRFVVVMLLLLLQYCCGLSLFACYTLCYLATSFHYVCVSCLLTCLRRRLCDSISLAASPFAAKLMASLIYYHNNNLRYTRIAFIYVWNVRGYCNCWRMNFQLSF